MYALLLERNKNDFSQADGTIGVVLVTSSFQGELLSLTFVQNPCKSWYYIDPRQGGLNEKDATL
jgi:hypothetical protein